MVYALRPLLACRCIEEYNCPPPVKFEDLLTLQLSEELRKGIDNLLEIKKVIEEKDLNAQIPVIYEFIKTEIDRQKNIADSIMDDHKKDWEALNQIFHQIITSTAKN